MNNRIAINQKRNKNFKNRKKSLKKRKSLESSQNSRYTFLDFSLDLKAQSFLSKWILKTLFQVIVLAYSLSLIFKSFPQLSFDIPVELYLILLGIGLSGIIGATYFSITIFMNIKKVCKAWKVLEA